MSPLWIAAAEGHLDTVSVLVEAGQQESLHIAAAGGYLDVVRLLLESGADVDLITKDGQTARDLALMNGHHKLVDELGTKRPLFVCWSPCPVDHRRRKLVSTGSRFCDCGDVSSLMQRRPRTGRTVRPPSRQPPAAGGHGTGAGGGGGGLQPIRGQTQVEDVLRQHTASRSSSNFDHSCLKEERSKAAMKEAPRTESHEAQIETLEWAKQAT
eukprot:s57_g34.t2